MTRLGRAAAVAGGALAASSAIAGGFLGTKSSPAMGPMQAETGGVGAMPFLQMMIALGIVLVVLKFLMPKLVGKLNKKLVTKTGSAIQIEESAAFAGGTLYVVSARSKTLLLSVTAQGVTCLTDLTENGTEPPSFEQMVEKEIQGPLQPFAVVGSEADVPESARVQEALARLGRLAG